MTSNPTDPTESGPARELLEALTRGDAGAGGPLLARLGCGDPEAAWRRLSDLLRDVPGEAREQWLTRLTRELPASADPNASLVNLARYAEARFGKDQYAALTRLPAAEIALLVRLFGYSPFLGDLIVRFPEYLDWLIEDPEPRRPRTRRDYRAAYDSAMGAFRKADSRRPAAARAQRRELLRLGVRRMMDWSDETTMMHELSDLAGATLDTALDEVVPPLIERFGQALDETPEGQPDPLKPARFCVVGMGKLGARELNFSSDIDLLFVYSAEGVTTGRADGAGRIPNHQFYTRLGEALITWLTEQSVDGYFYRVDMRLRPDGETAALARSLAAYEIYYAAKARSWERMALIKARGVAGDPALGQAFEAISRPLVFDPLHSQDIVEHIHDMKQRIDHEVLKRDTADREVKRGTGGIREIEFLVQAMQMLHGADHPELWQPDTLGALRVLDATGRLPHEQVAALAEDYLFLRTLEHRLQVNQMRQTHTLPTDPRELDRLALRCDPRRYAVGESADAPGRRLLADWRAVSQRVHRQYRDFFLGDRGTEGDTAPARSPAEAAARLVLSSEPESHVRPALEPFGLDGAGSLKVLRRMAGLTPGMALNARGADLFEHLLPTLIEVAGVAPRPEPALVRLESLVQATGATASYYEIFLHNRRLLELLLFSFGFGETLPRTLIAHPEFIDYFLAPEAWTAGADRAQMKDALLEWTHGQGESMAFAAALVRFKRFHHLLAGIGELAGLLDYHAACARVSITAELIVEAVVQFHARRMGLGGEIEQFAVLAMGKLGAGELNQFSDLDLIFVWDEGFAAAFPSPSETAAELAEHTIAMLTMSSSEGIPFQVDMRLRPEGQNAPIAPPLSRYLDYYSGGRAQVWELQSALRMRPIAGDPVLGWRMIDELAPIVASRARAESLAPAVRHMRRRLQDSLKLPRWVTCDLKKSRGGTVDLEFAAQYMQLDALSEMPELMGLGPLDAFERLAEAGRLERALADELLEDYLWMRRFERRIRLLGDSERTLVPASGEKLEELTRACRGLIEPGEDLTEALSRRLVRNRRHFDRLVADDKGS